MKTLSHLWQYIAKFFSEWEMFWTKVEEKIKTHILCSVTFFRKPCHLWGNVDKCGGTTGATNYVTTWRTRMLDKQGYMHACVCTRPRAWTHAHARAHTQIHNTYFCSTATVVMWMLRYTYIVCLVFCFDTSKDKINTRLYDFCRLSKCFSWSTYLFRSFLISISVELACSTICPGAGGRKWRHVVKVDSGGVKFLWNGSVLLTDLMTLHLTRAPSITSSAKDMTAVSYRRMCRLYVEWNCIRLWPAIVHYNIQFVWNVVKCRTTRNWIFWMRVGHISCYSTNTPSSVTTITWSVLRQVHSHLHSKFSTKCDVVLPFSISVFSRFLKDIH
jgi:hypothetical protein